MNVAFTKPAWKQFCKWQETDKAIFKKLLQLIQETQRSPKEGTGQPEALKYDLHGYWSRRIDLRHRLVYRELPINGIPTLLIASCQGHYEE